MIAAAGRDPAWIAVDWGSSRLRAWAMSSSDDVLDSISNDQGMNALGPSAFEPALLRAVEPWLGCGEIEVLACGMVGARQGWQEVDYVDVPARPLDLKPVQVRNVADPRLSVRIVPGLRQPEPADVIRGEEAQVAGFIDDEPDFDGVFCLPGTHTKWVRVANGSVQGFRTAMTGEVFELLARRSILRHSIAGDDMDLQAFDEACRACFSQPERLLSGLFSIRAGSLIRGISSATACGLLSGSLIGADLASNQVFWDDLDVAIIGADAIGALYERAIVSNGGMARRLEGETLVRRGLSRIRAASPG